MKKIKTLYLLRHKNIPEYTKIGITENINNRIKSLQTASPTGIEIIYTINSEYSDRLEKHLHNKYSRQQTNLEWFALTRDDIRDIIFYVEEIIQKRSKNV